MDRSTGKFYSDGWGEYRPTEEDIRTNREIVLADRVILRKDIPQYFSEENCARLREFMMWKRHGWPFVGNRGTHPAQYVDMVLTLDAVYEEEIAARQS